MEYLRKAHKHLCYGLCLLLLVSTFSIVILSVYIYLDPQLHQQILDIELDQYGNAYYGIGYSSGQYLFGQIYTISQLSKTLLLLFTASSTIYLATNNRLKSGVKIIGKNDYMELLLTVAILPVTLYGFVSLICNLFIGMIYPYSNLYIGLLIVIGLEIFIYYILNTRFSNNKYKTRIATELIVVCMIFVIISLLSYLYFNQLSPVLLISGLLALVVLLEVYIVKFTAKSVGI